MPYSIWERLRNVLRKKEDGVLGYITINMRVALIKTSVPMNLPKKERLQRIEDERLAFILDSGDTIIPTYVVGSKWIPEGEVLLHEVKHYMSRNVPKIPDPDIWDIEFGD